MTETAPGVTAGPRHLQRVIIDGRTSRFPANCIVVPRRSLKQGENVIELQFVAGTSR
jgi:hypothetical protein